MKTINRILLGILCISSTVFGITFEPKPLEFTGDISFRGSHAQYNNQETRDLFGSQLRLFTEIPINDQLRYHLGLATLSDNPRFKPTFNDAFNGNRFGLYYGFLSYQHQPDTSILLGKMINPIWSPQTFLWDTDLMPEGVSVLTQETLSPRAKFDGSFSYFVLDHNGSQASPSLIALQPRLLMDMPNKQKFIAALGYYQFLRIDDNVLRNSPGSNSQNADGSYNARFKPYVLSIQYQWEDSWMYLPFLTDPIFAPLFSASFEYINNTLAGDDNQGYVFGVRYGNEQLQKGKTSVAVAWHELQADAWLDVLPDSRRYYGLTDTRGTVVSVEKAMEENILAGVHLYMVDRIKAAADAEHRVIAEVRIKF